MFFQSKVDTRTPQTSTEVNSTEQIRRVPSPARYHVRNARERHRDAAAAEVRAENDFVGVSTVGDGYVEERGGERGKLGVVSG